MDVKKRLEELMNEREWTIYRLSQESGISWSTINNVFKKGTDPTISTLEIYCNAMGISLSQFFDASGQGGLTEEQRKMLDMWSTLNARERAAVMEMIEVILARS